MILNHLRNRLPSRGDIFLVFLVCVTAAHAWSLIHFLHAGPAYILQFEVWDILGLFAYTQGYALLESALLISGMGFLSFILPQRFFGDKFIPLGTIIVLFTYVWFILFEIYANTEASTAWMIGLPISLIVSYLAVQRLPRFRASLNNIAERNTVLACVYLMIAALSLIAVIIRNII